MGRKRTPGVEVRRWSSGRTTLRIRFYYRGVCCRETLHLKATPYNMQYATRMRGEILNAIERGTFCYRHYFPDSKRAELFGYPTRQVTVRQLLTDYLAQMERPLETSTYHGYKRVCETHLLPALGQLPIRELSPAVLRNWLRTLTLTAKTVGNILIPLRAIIAQALTDELIEKDPLSGLMLSKLLDKETRKSRKQIDPFNEKEITAILQTAQGQVRHLFQFAFYAGLRTSELIGLEWDDVDWINGTVRISRAVVRKRVKGTKSNAGERDVLLLPPALAALKAQKAYTFLAGQRVFHHPLNNGAWATDKQIRETAWRPLLKKAGVRYRYPYQTRHTYASLMLSNGENILWVAKQMGHVDTEMVMKTYGKWLPNSHSATGYQPVHNWQQSVPVAIVP